MSRAAEILKNSNKVVVKIGSNVLAGKDGILDKSKVENLVRQVLDLINSGKRVIIVSSGAGVSGAGLIGKLSRKNDINYKQALCAIGQVELMMEYKKHFAAAGKIVGQLLLTTDNFADDASMLNIRNTLFTLLDEGVIPIINENDSVCTIEMSPGDNDNLAALTSNLWGTDLLVLMTDVDGVYNISPKDNSDAILFEEIDMNGVDHLYEMIKTGGKSSFGTGGMDSKIEAAKKVYEYGIPTLVVNGNNEKVFNDVYDGNTGTLFL